jgi:hypothetical protein
MEFWKLPAWKKTFMQQVLAANSALKLYSAKAILTALRKVTNAYSLRAGWLVDMMAKEQHQYEQAEANLQKMVEKEFNITPAEPVPSPAQPEKPRPAFVPKKSVLRKLDE